MNTKARGRSGFTLVELLTVIAIISLLIAIVVPALSAARDQARRVSVAGQIKSLENGAEMFQGDNRVYPQSNGKNPFEPDSSNVYLSGAQWLALQLVGADLRGYVKPVSSNDVAPVGNPDGKIDHLDWLEWYSPTSTSDATRSGRYVTPGPKSVIPPRRYKEESNPGADDLPPQLTQGAQGGTSQYNNERLPFFMDTYGFPIVYYRATPGAKTPISIDSNANLKRGVYDQSDNAVFTGNDMSSPNGVNPIGMVPGWDFASVGATFPIMGGAMQVIHPMCQLGYNPSQPTKWQNDARYSFGHAILDKTIFDTSKTTGANPDGRLWPHNADRFILISPGRDGRYGTDDDIRNFAKN